MENTMDCGKIIEHEFGGFLNGTYGRQHVERASGSGKEKRNFIGYQDHGRENVVGL